MEKKGKTKPCIYVGELRLRYTFIIPLTVPLPSEASFLHHDVRSGSRG
jgi:hypothetical protein